jgi:hypothetical protein
MYVQLEATLNQSLLVVSSAEVPINADALPTFRVYGPSGFVEKGTCSLLDSGTITGATNASPIVITSAGHGLSTGDRVTIAGVGGNDAANGTFIITKVDADSFSLDGSTGDGAYTTGGTWNVTGLYLAAISALQADGYEKSEVYDVFFSYLVSSTSYGQVHSFLVV